jgi:hypothetical protein
VYDVADEKSSGVPVLTSVLRRLRALVGASDDRVERATRRVAKLEYLIGRKAPTDIVLFNASDRLDRSREDRLVGAPRT